MKRQFLIPGVLILALIAAAPSKASEFECIAPVDPGTPTGFIYDIGPLENGARLIGAGKGLFRLEGDRLAPVDPDMPTGSISEIGPLENGARLINAQRGLFRLEGDRLAPVDPDAMTGRIWEIGPLENGARLIGAERGLFRLEGDRFAFLNPYLHTGYISEIGPLENGARLIGAQTGLFRLEGDRLAPVDSYRLMGSISEIGPLENGARLINAQRGLFRLEGYRLALLDSDMPTGSISEIGPLENGGRLIGAGKGLFRLEGDRLERVDPGTSTGRIYEIGPLENGARLIGAENGLFRWQQPKAPARLENMTRTDALNDEEHLFEWRLAHPCLRVLPKAGLFRVVLEDREPIAAVIADADDPDAPADEFHVKVRAQIEADDGDMLDAVLEYRLDRRSDDWREVPGSSIQIRVDWGPEDHALHLAKTYGGWVALAHTFAFGGLLLTARRSRWSWRVLTDRVWGKIGAWFWFLMRHVPPVQRWILSLWFDTIRTRTGSERYLPVPLTGPEDAAMVSSELVGALSAKRRIWLQGAAGMGKTALIKDVVAQYFRDSNAKTLGGAYTKFGYVPIVITLRDSAKVPVPAMVPEDWLFDLAARTIEGAGLPIDDRGLLRSMLKSGYFVLILDGANEIDDGGAIQQFAGRFSEIGLLVTSQTEPEGEAGLFEIWRLPPDIQEATKPLLELYLGEERGAATFDIIESSPIRDDVHSGYDVRLLADLIDGGVAPDALPQSRLGLYEAMLDAVQRAGKRDYPLAELCKTAWQCWSEGRRDLVPGDNISAALLAPLKAEGVRIVQTQDGESYEFRHDQMRGYLAARWAALHEVSPVDLFEATPGIWRLERTDQQVVWEFFAELIAPEAGVNVLDWSRGEDERAVLQVALYRVAKRKGWVGDR